MRRKRHKLAPLVVVVVSATSRVARARHAATPSRRGGASPFGEWFALPETVAGLATAVVYGGWGKIAAAASAQYAIDRFAPQLLVNLGTCGGFAGEVERGEVLLADETLVYDIVEQMTDADEAIAERATTIDLSWLDGPGGSPPAPTRRPCAASVWLSADSDIVPAQVDLVCAAEVRRGGRRLGSRARSPGRPPATACRA